MRLVGAWDGKAQAVSIAFESNCYTDGFPLVDRAIFYNADFDLASPAFPLAAALLFRRYCGEVLEVNGSRLSLELVDAIGLLVPQVRSITPVDGNRRNNFVPGVEIYAAEAGLAPEPAIVADASTNQVSVIEWSGDFVDEHGPQAGRRRGQIFTNARLIAESSTAVSIAIALLGGGTRLGWVHVPRGDGVADVPGVTAALRAVGVSLRFH